MDLKAELISLLNAIDKGSMSSSVYDTAWLAQLGEIDRDLSNQALGCLVDSQLMDGSWGAAQPFNYYDRVVNTLAAMLALTRFGHRSCDRKVSEKGLHALEQITSIATRSLESDQSSSTVGFEMIVPTLVAEAEELGLIQQQKNRILGRLGEARIKKIEMLKGSRISRELTFAFSSEMAGMDGQNILDVDNLQEANGSVGNSPSATAYFALRVRPADEKALSYLNNTIQVKYGVPFASPFDIFERSWVLWNLSLMEKSHLDEEILAACQPHLDFLKASWRPGHGVGFAASYTPCDGDDTGVTFETLAHFGHKLDIDTLMTFEADNYFLCYPLEANPSISTNIHILGALKKAGYRGKQAAVKKILSFLKSSRISGDHWLDKWHTSPFYPTAHAIIALQGTDDRMCEDAIDWMLSKQNENGSWGYAGLSTAEETAYCIQALIFWKRHHKRFSWEPIDRGVKWLNRHLSAPYPPLWIGKGLYCPQHIVHSAILSALGMALQESGAKL